jgi:hypothetical protein
MPVERPGRGVHIVANAVINHGKPHYQNGLTGIVQKQDEPKTFDSLASRTQVQNGVKYFLRTKGECEVDAIGGATLGAGVWIDTTTDALALTDAAGRVPFGRVTRLPSTFGGAAGKMLVDMDLKDTLADA